MAGYGRNLENIVIMNKRSLIKKFAEHLLSLEKVTLEGIPGVIKQVYQKQSLYGALPVKNTRNPLAVIATTVMKK
jgi:hypothetical protein